MRIGCSTITFRCQNIQEALEHITKLGFDVIDVGAVPGWCDHIQLSSSPSDEAARVAETVRGRGLRIAGVQSVPFRADVPADVHAMDDFAEVRRRYTVAADAALAIDAEAWLLDPGMIDRGGRKPGVERFKRTIAVAAEIAEVRGLKLAIEAPNYGTLAANLRETIELLDSSDIPELGIDLDTSHLLRCGSSSADVLQTLGDRLVHVACRDGKIDGSWCTPGDGVFDFAEFFELLHRAGYKGPITMELIPSGDMTEADRENEARRARDYLEPLLASTVSDK